MFNGSYVCFNIMLNRDSTQYFHFFQEKTDGQHPILSLFTSRLSDEVVLDACRQLRPCNNPLHFGNQDSSSSHIGMDSQEFNPYGQDAASDKLSESKALR